MGRPSKLTPERQEKLVEAIQAGNYYTSACAYAEIAYSNFRQWMIKGEAEESGKYRDFHEAIKKAEAAAELRNVGVIQQAGIDTWQAAAWWLERRYPDRWGKQERLDLKHAGKVEVEHGVDVAGANALLAALGYGPLGSTSPDARKEEDSSTEPGDDR